MFVFKRLGIDCYNNRKGIPAHSNCNTSWNMKHNKVLYLISEVTVRVFVTCSNSRVSTFVGKQHSILSLDTTKHVQNGIVAAAAWILSHRWRKSQIFSAQTMFFTYPHMRKFICIRSGLLGSQIIGPVFLGHQLGSLAFRACRPLRLKWEWAPILLEYNCSFFCFNIFSVRESNQF
jgi:hypothetical protein